MTDIETFIAAAPAPKLGWARPLVSGWHSTVEGALLELLFRWPNTRKVTVFNADKTIRMVFKKEEAFAMIEMSAQGRANLSPKQKF